MKRTGREQNQKTENTINFKTHYFINFISIFETTKLPGLSFLKLIFPLQALRFLD